MSNENPDEIIENAVSELYRGYFLLRKNKRYKEEYDSMNALINMLQEDRQYMRSNGLVDF